MGLNTQEYQDLDAVALAALVRDGEVSPGELLEAARDRAAQVNPVLNAIVRFLPEEADRQVAGPLEGPLAGVPFLLKDFGQDYAGTVTSSGSASRRDHVATANATVVDRWLAAGLVVFGQTNTPEFAAKGVTEPTAFGPTRNPWDTTRTPGGSSGGAAAAVAAGVVPAAAASDGGGSIRIPAACCGLFGLKVGRGVVPSGPDRSEGFYGAAVNGVVSRSVRDTAAFLDVLRGEDPTAPYPLAAGDPWLPRLDAAPPRLRIGFRTENDLAPADPEARAAVLDAAALLTDQGHDVEEIDDDGSDARLAEDFLLPWFVHVALEVQEDGGDRGHEFDTRIMAAIGRATSAPELEAALARWHGHALRLAARHRTHDLLLTPTIARPPVRIGALATPWYERLGGSLVLALRAGRVLPHLGIVQASARKQIGWVPYTQLANLTGRPAMSVPTWWTPSGLPLGVQFVARPGAELLLLRLATQLERARPWVGRRPPLS